MTDAISCRQLTPLIPVVYMTLFSFTKPMSLNTSAVFHTGFVYILASP